MEREAEGDVHMHKACGPAVVHLTLVPLYTNNIWIYKVDISHICTLPAQEMHFTKAAIMKTVNIFMRTN